MCAAWQLTGYNLIPFHYDKQMLMLTNINNIMLYGIPPIASACLLAACWTLYHMCLNRPPTRSHHYLLTGQTSFPLNP